MRRTRTSSRRSTATPATRRATFYLNDKLFATLGGRYTKDKKEGTYAQTANAFIGKGIFRAPEALTFPDLDQSRFTYRLGLNYQPTKDHLIYASYSTGYKSGGYNSGGSSLPLSTFDASGNLVSTKRIFDPRRSRTGKPARRRAGSTIS